VNFKVFGLMGLTFLFVLTQLPLMNRHALPESVEEVKAKADDGAA
jgi:intracellular septation protein A